MRPLRLFMTYLVFVPFCPFLFLHPKLRQGFWQRFGFGKAAAPAQGHRFWLHGASAGDVLALVPTARELRVRWPHCTLTLTTMTDSGNIMARQHTALFDNIRYFPWDLPGAVLRTLKLLNPSVIILEYTELWPELLHQAKKRNIPAVMHNGRFSRERLGRYQQLFQLTGNLVQELSLLLVRDESEKERALELGANAKQVFPTGNTKFEHTTHPPSQDEQVRFSNAVHLEHGQCLWVAGSTHDSEEVTLLDAFVRLRETFPNLRLILAPRYVERGNRIRELVLKRKLEVCLRTQPATHWDVLILNTVGELYTAYALASVVFVGGSFTSRGGHNIVEPALCGKPVIFGPNMNNVEDSVQLLLGRGGLQVANGDQLERVVGELLEDDPKREQLGLRAAEQARCAQGTAAKNAAHIEALLA